MAPRCGSAMHRPRRPSCPRRLCRSGWKRTIRLGTRRGRFTSSSSEAHMLTKNRSWRLLVVVLGVGISSLAIAAEKGQWTPISAGVLAQVKPGYPGKTAGVAVDPATGDVYMVVPDQGLWKSSDQGD